jgi:hypothetical protein
VPNISVVAQAAKPATALPIVIFDRIISFLLHPMLTQVAQPELAEHGFSITYYRVLSSEYLAKFSCSNAPFSAPHAAC